MQRSGSIPHSTASRRLTTALYNYAGGCKPTKTTANLPVSSGTSISLFRCWAACIHFVRMCTGQSCTRRPVPVSTKAVPTPCATADDGNGLSGKDNILSWDLLYINIFPYKMFKARVRTESGRGPVTPPGIHCCNSSVPYRPTGTQRAHAW